MSEFDDAPDDLATERDTGTVPAAGIDTAGWGADRGLDASPDDGSGLRSDAGLR